MLRVTRTVYGAIQTYDHSRNPNRMRNATTTFPTAYPETSPNVGVVDRLYVAGSAFPRLAQNVFPNRCIIAQVAAIVHAPAHASAPMILRPACGRRA